MILALTSTQRTVAWVIGVLAVGGWLVYLWFNIRSAKPETGSEIELAANRATPPDDDVLEGSRLEKMQFWGVAFLVVISIGLPLYWLREPGRQASALDDQQSTNVSRGETHYNETFQCVNCHGPEGGGGAVSWIEQVNETDAGGDLIIDEETGEVETFNVAVNWAAPAINNVFTRFSREEVTEIITYGRANTPMAAWGLAGGASGTEQQISDLVDYLMSEEFQLDPGEVADAYASDLEGAREEAEDSGVDFDAGEWLFGEHCARCHTRGWSITPQGEDSEGERLEVGPPGGGAFGPLLSETSLTEQFPTPQSHVDFITSGSEENVGYGTRGVGSGMMPGFGETLTEESLRAIVDYERSLNPTEASGHSDSSARGDLSGAGEQEGDE